MASGRMLRRNSSIAEVMQHDLESYGVPAGSIVVLSHRADNTREEAEEVARLIHTPRVEAGHRRYFQLPRAPYAFSFMAEVLPASVTFRVSGARDSEFDPSNWWQTRQGQKLFFNELAGYLIARWELRARPAPQNESAILILQLQFFQLQY